MPHSGRPIRGNLARLDEARDWWEVCSRPLQADRGRPDVLLAAAAELLPADLGDAAGFTAWIEALKASTGLKGKALFQPLRLALTGREHGPELKHLLPLLGRERALAPPARRDGVAPAKHPDLSRPTVQLRVHNTLTRTKEVFEPIDPNRVRMYVCGPTVYDRIHVGNARAFVVFDVLYRLLRHLYGADVTYVRNITDIDDKIMDAARQNGESIRALTDRTTADFQADIAALGCLPPTHEPRATEYVAGMIAHDRAR